MASTLQAQLAALNGTAGKHPGSTFAPNKRHEDAVGRGIDYNVQQGQVVYHRGVQFRATIIHDNPKKAADIPLSTLEENCQEALTFLSEILPSLASTSTVLCGQDDASNAFIQRLLTRISILLGENDKEVTEKCLHVLEYLLRRYEIHRHLMEDFVWTFLPYHQQLTNTWHRCLLLVDLASHPSYLWLRPYADAHRPAPTPRPLVARRVIQETPLLRRLTNLVRKTAAEEAMEPEDASTPLRGWSHLFSWAATYLVDGLVWQQQESTIDREALARILVPAVRLALAGETEDYYSWGCIMASTMAECLDLSASVLAQWGTTLLNNGSAEPSTVWSTLASLLLAEQDPNRVEEESYLKLLGRNEWIGCPLPTKLFTVLQPDCAVPLASLYHELEVTPLVVSIFVRAVRANKVDFATALLEEEELADMWQGHNLVASVAAHVVQMVAGDLGGAVQLATGRAVLKSLCERFASAACEKGVATVAVSVEPDKLEPLIDGIVTLVSSGADKKTDMLPPRVALEHPDVEVRRQALAQLVQGMDSDQSLDDMDDGETLMETLVRRWSVEPDQSLAHEFAQTLEDSEAPMITAHRSDEQCQGVLSGAYYWMETGSKMTNLLSKILGKAVHEANEIGESGPTFQLLQEVAVCLVKHSEAANSMQVLDVLSDSVFLQRLVENFVRAKGQFAEREERARHGCAWALLAALADSKNGDKSFVMLYVQLYVQVMRSRTTLDKSHQNLAEKSLRRISLLLSDSPDKVVDALSLLATLRGKEVTSVIDPKLRSLASSVTDPAGKKVSPLAVLVEAAARTGTPLSSTKKLMVIAREVLDECAGSEWVALVPSLVLLSHADKGVRESSVGLLSAISSKHGERKNKDTEISAAFSICEVVSNEAASVVQVGTSLPSLLSRCIEQPGSEKAVSSLLRLAVHAVFTSARSVRDLKSGELESACWLSVDKQSGTREAGCEVLEAMEDAGEDAFSLSNRWKYAGKLILKWLVSLEQNTSDMNLARITVLVARLLKGVIVSGPHVLISSGPDNGGARSRSYSVGNLDGVEVIRPYPKDMVASILDVIDNSVYIRDVVAEKVLGSTSWCGFVFPLLDSQERKRIVRSLLKRGSDSQSDSLLGAATSLPLDSQEAADLVEQAPVTEGTFPYLAVLTNYLKANASRLAGRQGAGAVIAKLFDTIRNLSTLEQETDHDGVEYLLQSSLRAIRDLLGDKPESLPSDSLPGWVDLIMSLLGAPPDQSLTVPYRLKTWRERSLCLSILTAIASFNAEAVVESVADLALQVLSKPDSFSTEEERSVLSVAVPLFWSNVCSISRSLTSFLKELLSIITRKQSNVRNMLLRDLVKALSGTTDVEEEYRNLTPGIMSVLLVAITKNKLPQLECNEMVVLIFESSPTSMQVMSLPYLVAISRQVLGHVLGSPDLEDSSRYLPSCSEIIELVGPTQDSEAPKTTDAFGFISDTLSVACECVVLDNVQKSLRKRNTAIATASIQLWQNLLLIHATAEAATAKQAEADPEKIACWRTISTLAEECRESVQGKIPSTVFMAAVRSLLKETVTADLRSRALRLASDRVLAVDPDGQDRTIFLEFLADATDLARSQTEEVRVRQGALVYIEHTTRSLFRPGSHEKSDITASQKVTHALSVCSDVVKNIFGKPGNFQEFDVATWHLLTSVALACTTIIRSIGIKALPQLAPLLKAYISVLSHVIVKRNVKPLDDDGDSCQSMIQIAVLRLVLSSTQTAPQSIFAHLPALLSESGIFAETLTTSGDPAVTVALHSVHDAMASTIPARLLIPALVKLNCADTTSPKIMMYVFEVLSKSVSRLETNEGGIYRSSVTKAALKAFELQYTQAERRSLIDQANQCLLGLVMKLSEVQFRKMYGELSEWMGQSRPERRYPFWALSEVLSRELNSIFLPCASLVFEDIVKDLNMFAGSLSKGDAVEVVQGGQKKRKKSSEAHVSLDEETSSSLVPILATVTSILRADAQVGGKWTREHGRYHAILEPLGMLIQGRIPENVCPVDCSFTPYEYIVEENSRGSVVECLTALALAAGDEQLWKPLNHAVLDACGNPGRSEVRKAGVVCLLSLLRTLGEEYMILLPECLPVLSELLEDENEVITGLARDAVATAEDLLGESLEDNLK